MMNNGTVGVAPGTTTVMLDNGQAYQFEDWIDDKLYSTVQLSNTQTGPVEAFSGGKSQPLPGGSRNSQRVDTNVPRAGANGLPTSWEMYIYTIGMRAIRACRPQTAGTQPVLADTSGALSDPVLLSTLFQVERLTYFEFKYNEKPYTYGVMGDYPAGTGLHFFSTATGVEMASIGKPSPRDRTALVLPIRLREGIGFVGIFQPDAALVISQAASDEGTDLTFMDVKVELFGLIKRQVT